jgi:hypothetical protein
MESTKGVFWRSSPQLLKETSDSNQKDVARLESPGPHLQFGPLLSALENCVHFRDKEKLQSMPESFPTGYASVGFSCGSEFHSCCTF